MANSGRVLAASLPRLRCCQERAIPDVVSPPAALQNITTLTPPLVENMNLRVLELLVSGLSRMLMVFAREQGLQNLPKSIAELSGRILFEKTTKHIRRVGEKNVQWTTDHHLVS